MTTMTNHTTYDNERLPIVEPVVETTVNTCPQGHEWQPTIIIGYFHCVRCNTLAACRICVSKMRGKPLVGVCQQHQHLCASQVEQEVLA